MTEIRPIRATRPAIRLAALALGLAALFISETSAPHMPGFGLVSLAEARDGRPQTPVSYAGVARRTTRRAVVGTAAVAGTAYAVAPRAGCIEAIDAYGRTYWRCP